ncbi:MAG: carbohydrate kinase family protein [Candidatus Peribacteraceae bacterium]
MVSPATTLRSLSVGGATYDLFVSLSDAVTDNQGSIVLPSGSKTTIKGVIEACGGGAANTSVGLSRLGLDASFCGVLGSDQWGEKMLANMKKEGVRTESATIVEGETSSFSVIISTGSDRSILTARGVSEHLHDVTFDLDAVKKSDVIYLNHLCETSCMIENDIVRMLNNFSGHLTWNPGGCQIDAGMHQKDKNELLALTSLLLLNKEEALRFTGEKSVESAIERLRAAGVKCVCVTDGKNGAVAENETGRYHCPVLPVTIVDTTGAGDAFGTGMTWALSSGQSLQISMIAGTLNASRVVSTIGAEAGLLSRKEMESLLAANTIVTTTIA